MHAHLAQTHSFLVLSAPPPGDVSGEPASGETGVGGAELEMLRCTARPAGVASRALGVEEARLLRLMRPLPKPSMLDQLDIMLCNDGGPSGGGERTLCAARACAKGTGTRRREGSPFPLGRSQEGVRRGLSRVWGTHIGDFVDGFLDGSRTVGHEAQSVKVLEVLRDEQNELRFGHVLLPARHKPGANMSECRTGLSSGERFRWAPGFDPRMRTQAGRL